MFGILLDLSLFLYLYENLLYQVIIFLQLRVIYIFHLRFIFNVNTKLLLFQWDSTNPFVFLNIHRFSYNFSSFIWPVPPRTEIRVDASSDSVRPPSELRSPNSYVTWRKRGYLSVTWGQTPLYPLGQRCFFFFLS